MANIFLRRLEKSCQKHLKGERHPQWKGGISFAPYCQKFNEAFKESIREKFSHKCFICGKPENGHKHAVHHIDYDKGSICNGKNGDLCLYVQVAILKLIPVGILILTFS